MTPSAATDEDLLEQARQRRIRRQPVILLAVLNALVLAVGSTAALDLRRLDTPRGASLAWVQAAVFGDCTPYAELSLPDPADRRSDAQRCRDLRFRTRAARAMAAQIALRPGSAVTDGSRATADVVLTRPGSATLVSSLTVSVALQRTGGHWRVLLDERTCAQVACA